MKRNIASKYWFFFLVVPVFIACSAPKKLKEIRQEKVVESSDISMSDILNRQTDYRTFSTKAKARLSLDGKLYDVTLNIRNKRNEILWVSLTYLAGLEAVRLIITPDSVRLLNRINSEYVAYPFEFIHHYVSKQIGFNALEDMLVGNSPDILFKGKAVIGKEKGMYFLNGVAGDLMFDGNYSALLKPQRINITQSDSRQSLGINYNSYTEVDTKLVPFKVDVVSELDSKSVNINLEYQNPQFNLPLEYPFSVPKRFTRIE